MAAKTTATATQQRGKATTAAMTMPTTPGTCQARQQSIGTGYGNGRAKAMTVQKVAVMATSTVTAHVKPNL